MNSFNDSCVSDNFKLRQQCLGYLDLDIIGVAETKLRYGRTIKLPGYKFFDHNRKELHRHARNGSGGVGVFVRDSFLLNHTVSVLDKTLEGVLWIQIKVKGGNEAWNICVVYLPPQGSSRYVDAGSFFEDLHAQIFNYQNNGNFLLMGDFNSRLGNKKDFIEGVDVIADREVIDHKLNGYSDLFCDFLSSASCIVLNGRNSVKNDYTFVSTRGHSVVDYMISSQSAFSEFSGFEVIRARSLFTNAKCDGIIDPVTGNLPDHSILKCHLNIKGTPIHALTENSCFKSYNRKVIPEDFLQGEGYQKIQDVIIDFERKESSQHTINEAFADFTEIIKKEMDSKLTSNPNSQYRAVSERNIESRKHGGMTS